MTETESRADAFRYEVDSWAGWFDVLAAVLLGVATLASAWSAYQAALWEGIQTFRIAEANAAGRQAAGKDLYSNQLRSLDAVLFERYVSAIIEKNDQLAEFLFQRFRPEMRVAVEAWLATKPWHNPSAPLTPFSMDAYVLAAGKEARQLQMDETKNFAEARDADEISDTYLLLTVLYGIVLFLGGIAAVFEEPRLRIVLLVLAAAMLTVTTMALAFLPLAQE